MIIRSIIALLLIVYITALGSTFLFAADKKMSAEDIEWYIKRCEQEDGSTCWNLGDRYHNGEGVEQNDFKAVDLYKKGCDKKYAYGCNALGDMYYKGYGVRQSDSDALKYYGKACDLNNSMGCSNYAKVNRKQGAR